MHWLVKHRLIIFMLQVMEDSSLVTDMELTKMQLWDDRFELRRMTVPALRGLAREKGIRNTSKLRKKELLLVLEKALGLHVD